MLSNAISCVETEGFHRRLLKSQMCSKKEAQIGVKLKWRTDAMFMRRGECVEKRRKRIRKDINFCRYICHEKLPETWVPNWQKLGWLTDWICMEKGEALDSMRKCEVGDLDLVFINMYALLTNVDIEHGCSWLQISICLSCLRFLLPSSKMLET